MNAPDLNQATGEPVRGGEGAAHQPALESYDVTAALNLVSETAAAIKAFDEQAAQALMRAREVADAVKEELGRAELRAERAETMLRLAEAQIEQMLAAAEQADNELELLRSQLAAKTAEYAASERRGDDAEAAIERIVAVIRAQLPAKLNVPSE
ncbi:ABC transporter permease [Methylocystis sp. SB2]|jgi:chromosome segregation ATPase|uniref:ABC transporter permease n=1 Tax=Methylocystis sp. (strain SB2) TaxID=743836 RepID=UPI001EFB9B93|nr:ABC transporter permease [Methylocystis sp. SB2]ULO23786.1 ABC transporter permease [Methylocystis sp. SB2]